MNNERYTQILISILIAVVLFTTGFYAGKKESKENIPAYFLNASSTDSVDMAPFWKVWEILLVREQAVPAPLQNGLHKYAHRQKCARTPPPRVRESERQCGQERVTCDVKRNT